MACFDVRTGAMKTILFCFLLLVPACASQPKNAPETIDPRISALQRENRRLIDNQIVAQKSVEELYQKLIALEAKLDFLETQVLELTDKPEPILITPSHSVPLSSSEASSIREKIASSAKQEETPPGRPKEGTEVKKSVIAKKKSAKSSESEDQDIEEKYDRAYAAYTATRYDESLALFKDFIKQHPQHHLADNAQYWIGEIYYDIENYPSAILAFKEVVTNYGDENKAPDALLKIGYAYLALDDPNNARLFFKRVIKNYPFSEAEANARVKLKELQNF